MQGLLRLSRAIDAFTEVVGKVGVFLITFLILVGFYSVAARYIGREIGRTLTSNGIFEVQWYFYSFIYLISFGYILKHNLNVRVDFLYSKWSPRRKAWVDLLGTVFLLIPFCILAIYVSINPILSSWGRLPNGEWGRWEMSPDPSGLPRAPIKTMIIVSFSLLLLQAVSQAIKYLAILRGLTPEASVLLVETYEQVAVE